MKATLLNWRKRFALWLTGHYIKQNWAGIHLNYNPVYWDANVPTLYFANHISIWDGNIGCYLTHRVFGQDPYVMRVEGLVSPISKWSGSFTINNRDPYKSVKGIQHAIKLLQTVPNCGLWIFPQGDITPINRRPLGFYHGISTIIRRVEAIHIVPVVFYHTFLIERRLESFIRIAPPVTLESTQRLGIITQLEDIMTRELEIVQQDVASGNLSDYKTSVVGHPQLQHYIAQLGRELSRR